MAHQTSTGVTGTSKYRWRWHARTLLAFYLIVIGMVLFQPTPTMAVGSIGRFADLVIDLGFPQALLVPYWLEFVVNILIFIPVSILGYWAVPASAWSDWVAYVFLMSLSVEAVQGLLLPYRSAQHVDVVANTLGAVIGALAVQCALWMFYRRRSTQ